MTFRARKWKIIFLTGIRRKRLGSDGFWGFKGSARFLRWLVTFFLVIRACIVIVFTTQSTRSLHISPSDYFSLVLYIKFDEKLLHYYTTESTNFVGIHVRRQRKRFFFVGEKTSTIRLTSSCCPAV